MDVSIPKVCHAVNNFEIGSSNPAENRMAQHLKGVFMAAKNPRKPAQRPGSVIYGPTGTKIIMEALPDLQQERECTVVRKFVGALAHFERRALSPPIPGSEPADCLSEEGGQKIGIQVTDVVKPTYAHRRGIQEKYAERIRELVADSYDEFDGISITLYHQAQNPLPPANSQQGKQLTDLVVQKLRASIPELKKWDIGHAEAYSMARKIT
jgi:hypothetical protein